VHSLLFLPFPLELIFEIAGPEEAKSPAVLRLIQNPLSAAEYPKIRSRLSKQFASHSSTQ
jgi:hypothetical protein